MVLALLTTLATLAANGVLLAAAGLVLLTVLKRCVCPRLRSVDERRTRRAAVLVLGDVGRSPRMQYHAWSIAELNTPTPAAAPSPSSSLPSHASSSPPTERYEVDLIGYAGEACIDRVRRHPHIKLRRFAPLRRPARPRLPFIIWAPLKVTAQVLRLLYMLLFTVPTPDVLLVQTPPAIPTLLVAIVAAAVTGARLVVDWHNFGYTILQINLRSARHPFVRVAYWYERVLSRFSSGNLCVTHAMREWLLREWGVRATVLHDQPPDFFHRTDAAAAHALFRKFEADPASSLKAGLFASPTCGSSGDGSDAGNCSSESGGGGSGGRETTLLTELDPGTGAPRLRADRPVLVVSSTSWTEDEDFGILLDAVVALDARVAAEERERAAAAAGAAAPSFPRVLVVVTGKGPQKAMYEAKIAKLPLVKCRVVTAWLEAADYPVLLGCCDLGVSLHYSSSGLDLPMKVLDMFGAGMPVCAVDFACLGELVRDGVNGLVFAHRSGPGSGAQLARQLHDLFEGFADGGGGGGGGDTRLLARLRDGVRPGSWAENWRRHARAELFPPS